MEKSGQVDLPDLVECQYAEWAWQHYGKPECVPRATRQNDGLSCTPYGALVGRGPLGRNELYAHCSIHAILLLAGWKP